MRSCLALLPLLWPVAASATPLQLTYEGTLAGARMIHAEARLDQTDVGYILHTGVQTVGAFAVLVRGHSDIISQGLWQGTTATPSHVDSEGYWNGHQRRMVVDYQDGVPIIRVMVPTDPDREQALERDDTAGTTDVLGLMVGLMRQVAATGACDRQSRVFDGHGVIAFVMTTASSSGPDAPLRCDFTTHKVAGVRPHEDPKRVEHGYALFGIPGPGLPRLPVRIVFETRWTGDAVLALTDARPAP